MQPSKRRAEYVMAGAVLLLFLVVALWFYRDFHRIPPDVLAAYQTFLASGDPYPIAALGDRGQPLVPTLAELSESEGFGSKRKTDIQFLFGIMGGPEATRALIREADEMEASLPPSRMRLTQSYPLIFSLALVDSKDAAARPLTFPLENEVETIASGVVREVFDVIPDDPDLILGQMNREKENVDRIVLANLSRFIGPGDYPRIAASEILGQRLIDDYDRLTTFVSPQCSRDQHYFDILGRIQTPDAVRFYQQANPEHTHSGGGPSQFMRFGSAVEIAQAYERAGRNWKAMSQRGVADDADFSSFGQLARALNADPSPLAWSLMGTNRCRHLEAMGAAIVPFLIAQMEHPEYSNHEVSGVDCSFQSGQLQALYLLRRATGQNFGLNPAAWRDWCYRDLRHVSPDILAAYQSFVETGDPYPIARLGDRGQVLVRFLAGTYLPNQPVGADEIIIMAILGGTDAQDAILHNFDQLDTGDEYPSKFRYPRAGATIIAAGFIGSPRLVERLLRFPVHPDFESSHFDDLGRSMEVFPDDPDFLPRVLSEAGSKLDKRVLKNLISICREEDLPPVIAANEAFTRILIENRERYAAYSSPLEIYSGGYYWILSRMTPASAREFYASINDDNKPKSHPRQRIPCYETADELVEAFDAAGHSWESVPLKGLAADANVSYSPRLAAVLNANPSLKTWRIMTSLTHRHLRSMGETIVPYLVGMMEQHRGRSDQSLLYGSFSIEELECLHVLRRATGQNFGLNPAAWRDWWEREGKAQAGLQSPRSVANLP